MNPELYLAVAIHQVQGKEEEALSLFSSAFNHFESNDVPPPGPRSELWARANWARLLRRLDRVREAEAQEQAILCVILHVRRDQRTDLDVFFLLGNGSCRTL